jgi:hypothetical protein
VHEVSDVGFDLPRVRVGFQPLFDSHGFSVLNEFASPLWPNVILEEALIDALCWFPTSLRRFLCHEAIYQGAHGHKVELLLRILRVDLNAPMFNSPYRISLRREFFNRSD